MLRAIRAGWAGGVDVLLGSQWIRYDDLPLALVDVVDALMSAPYPALDHGYKHGWFVPVIWQADGENIPAWIDCVYVYGG